MLLSMVIDAHVRSLLFVVYATDIIHIFYPSNGATKSKNRRPSRTACGVQRRTRQKKKEEKSHWLDKSFAETQTGRMRNMLT